MRYLTALVLLALTAPSAHAERYRVDLIVFADRTGVGDESPLAGIAPDLSRAIEPGDAARLRAAGIELVSDANFGLADAWRKLGNSQRHQPLLRLAWIQKDPPAERGPALRLRAGAPLGGATSSYAVDGTVSLLMGRFLHLDAHLLSTTLNSTGEPRSYLLRERRRMRRGELHHLDSPRLGLLARVEKVKEAAPNGSR